MTFEYTDEMVEEVLDEFDFHKVKLAMDALDWEWRGVGVPSIADLRREARRLLKCAIKETGIRKEQIFTGCGGLEAECDGHGFLKLRFVVADWETGPKE